LHRLEHEEGRVRGDRVAGRDAHLLHDAGHDAPHLAAGLRAAPAAGQPARLARTLVLDGDPHLAIVEREHRGAVLEARGERAGAGGAPVSAGARRWSASAAATTAVTSVSSPARGAGPA